MTQWVDQLKETIPDYAKDTKLNLDAVIKRSTLIEDMPSAIALAAAFATGQVKLWTWLYEHGGSGEQWIKDREAALTAASLMSMNNTWYPYVEMADDEALKGIPAQLRMNAIATSGGTTKDKFEAYSLAASIVNKCNFCIKSHYGLLKQHGYTVEQLRDIGRISSVIVAVSKILST